ncbi:MAG: ABC transporter permease [Bacteroidales bacterium]|jgi:ABC-type transport system involved in multi-copper enzyme maturation permease subunit|nr:ABC transporter permease [Bacteroidales bacterium]
MFGILFIREIQNCLYSLRFQVSFIIVLLVFAIGSISFTKSFSEAQEHDARYRQEHQKILEDWIKNASNMATSQNRFIMSPRENGLISDCREQALPNLFTYSAYNVFGFSVRHNSANPLMKKTEALNWSFIVSMILSFMTLLCAYDAISGEKEDRTLALCLSNPVSRGAILFAKFLSVVAVMASMLVVGILVSLLIMSLTGSIVLNGGLPGETAGFVGISLLFIAAMTVVGLLSSALTRNSNVSLLISLCFWLAFAVVIPNTSVFWANRLFPIAHIDEVDQRIEEGRQTLNREAPDGSWSSNSGDPFFPRHELRANLQTKLMLNEKQHRDAYYADMFRQFENTRLFTMISPMAQFDCMNEAMLGGGYLRFHKNWDDLHVFQSQFLQWFKDLDIKDDKSPHWYNPHEDYSTTRQEVSLNQVPTYTEQPADFAQRFSYMRTSLIFLSAMVIGVFVVCFVLLARYDVR